MKKYNVTVNGSTYEVLVEEVGEVAATPTLAAPITPAPAPTAAPVPAPAAPNPTPAAAPTPAGAVNVTAPMPGTILKMNVQIGQTVKKGDSVCVLEAMKMENDIPAPQDGRVVAISVSQGATVMAGDVLVSLS